MNPTDFLKTAEHLKDQDGEHYVRSSISRSYYAIYLHVRHFISKTFLGGRKFKKDPHQKLIDCLQFCDAPDIKSIGVMLSDLRQARTEADYEMTKAITAQKCQDIFEGATDLLSDFEDKISIDTNKQKFARSSQLQAKYAGVLPS